MKSKPAFVIHDLNFRYTPSSPLVLKNINLTINEGEYVALLGANGSGKSTLLSCLNTLVQTERGCISVYDREGRVFDPALEKEEEEVRHLTASVMQNPDDQILGSTVEEDIAFGLQDLSAQQSAERVEYALLSVNLEHCRHKAPNSLSGGERCRLALAAALASFAPYILLDESLSMLDPQSRFCSLKLIGSMVESGKTVIHATHSLQEAMQCRRCLVLEDGVIVFDGAPGQLLCLEHLTRWHFHIPQQVEALRLFSKYIEGLSIDSLEPSIFAKIIEDWDKKNAAPVAPSLPCNTHLSSKPLLRFEKVRSSYAEDSSPTLYDLSIDIAESISVALIGKNGVGKSTFMYLANALLIPQEGSVSVAGLVGVDKRTKLQSIRLKASLAVQSPESALFEHYVADDVAFGPKNKGLKGPPLRDAVASAMEEVGLPFDVFCDREIKTLSGGEKRKAAIAGVLALDSPIVLLDEPDASLDGESCERVMTLINELKGAGKTVVASCHSMETAARFDMVAVFSQGRIVAYDSPNMVFGPLWDESWGLSLPWTVSVARFLLARGVSLSQNVPLSVASLFDSLFQSPSIPIEGAIKKSEEPIPPVPLKRRRRKAAGALFQSRLLPSFVQGSPLSLIRCDIKLAAFILCALSLLITGSIFVSLCITFASVSAGIIFAKLPLRAFRALLFTIPLLVFMLFLHFVFSWQNDGSAILFSLWRFSLSFLEFSQSVSTLCRLSAFMGLIIVYTASSTMQESLFSLRKVLSPFERLGLPVSDIFLSITIAFRFVPVITNEASCIVKAQLSRGSSGTLRTALSIIIPLFLRTLERSIKLAKALLLRAGAGPALHP